MKLLKLSLAICLMSCSARAISEEARMSFEQVACQISAEAIVVTWKNPAGDTRRIAFMDQYREFALKSPDTKGLLKWSNTKAVHVASAESTDGKRLMKIEYRYERDDSLHLFEAGLIDGPCLSSLRERYGASLKFTDN
jgi:hypothetical protein